jgi:Tol biopolymer transport system component
MVAAALAAGILALVTLVEPAEAAFPGANGRIAFVSDRLTTGNPIPPGQTSPDYEIFTMKPDGTNIQQATFNTAIDTSPSFSADGTKIVFASTLDGDFEIYMADPNGAQQTRLTNNSTGDFNPAFSPGGDKIVFVRDGEIYMMDAVDINPADGNGDNLINLTNNAAGDSDPAFSPDGTKIAFTSNRDGNLEIYVMDADGTDQTRLTNNAAPGDEKPNWSPGGSKIAFTSLRDGNYAIYVMNALDGSEQKRLTKKAAADDYSPAFSPNGKKIAFTSGRGGGDNEIYVMKPRPESRKNRPKNLTRNDVVIDSNPDWQPVQ